MLASPDEYSDQRGGGDHTRRRRRRWSIEEKREIVAESLQPGIGPSEIIRKHGISSGQLSTGASSWRAVSAGAGRVVGEFCPRRCGCGAAAGEGCPGG